MPLPPNDPVAFRGVPSLGGNKKVALTMTFTQKQVEAMFQHRDTLRAQGSSQCPLEIDFDENKIYIGDITTPFTRVKEDGTREICQRSPTVSKPFAGITLAGNVIGKLNIQRDYDQDIAENIRKVTEAEVSKRKERNIVRLDSPPILINGKKLKPGSGTSLAKRAMTNRIVSTQAASSRTPASASPSGRPAPSKSSSLSNRPTPPSSSTRSTVSSSSAVQSTPNSSTSTELDLTSLRSHMIHYLALDPRTYEETLLKIGGNSPTAETVREIEEILTTVAEEVPRPKNAAQGPVQWQLRIRSWEEVRPYEYGPLSDTDRKKMARRGRITLGPIVDSGSPLWEHLRADVDVGVTPSSIKGKGKAKPTVNRPLVKTSDFKGGMFPKDKKSGTKGGGVANGGITKSKSAAPKSKAKKEEDEVEAKARKVIAALDNVKGKGKGAPNISIGTMTNKSKPKEEGGDEEAIPLSTKSRQSLAHSHKKDSTSSSKLRQVQDTKRKSVNLRAEDSEEMEEGELPTKPAGKKLKVAAELKTKPNSIETDTPVTKFTKDKGTDSAKEENTFPKSGKESAPSRPGAGGSSSKASISGGKLKTERDKERQDREPSDLERLKDREREKRRTTGKRGRRVTPSFSSDEDEEAEVKTTLPLRVTKQKTTIQSSAPSRLAVPAVKTTRAPSPTLPTDKEGLRRRYHLCYARYMGVTSKFHEQIAKIEEALSADTGSVSAEDDADMMDTDQLMQLRGEHERLRDELERIQRAHAMVF